MADDSWMEEFFTFPDDMDEIQGVDHQKVDRDITGSVFCHDEGVGGQTGQGAATSQFDIDLAVLPPWDWTVNTGQEYPILTDDNINVEPNAQWLIAMESFNHQAQFFDIVQDQTWTNAPNMAIRFADTYPEANTDIDDAFLPTIQTAENSALFGNKGTTPSQHPSPSAVHYNETIFDIEPKSAISPEITYTTIFDRMSHDHHMAWQFDSIGSEISAAPITTGLHQYTQQESIENSMVRIDNAPKKRYLWFSK
jgi:hypothetical protein